MTNNDILRRIRYTFDLTDSAMVDVFAAAGPSDSTPIAVVAVQDVIGAQLSRVRIVLASREISAGDRIAVVALD